MKRKVFIAVPTLDGKVGMGLAQFLCAAERRTLDADYPWAFRKGFYHGYRPVAYMRNTICQDFLRSDCDRLWFLDADIVPPPRAFELLDVEGDIVAGAVPGYKRHASGEGIAIQVLAYERRNGTHDSIPLPNEQREVDAAGTGCMVISRDVLKDRRMRLSPDMEGEPPHIFELQQKPSGQIEMTADVDFCRRSRELGYKIKLWPNEMFGQYESLDLRDVAAYGARCAAAAQVVPC